MKRWDYTTTIESIGLSRTHDMNQLFSTVTTTQIKALQSQHAQQEALKPAVRALAQRLPLHVTRWYQIPRRQPLHSACKWREDAGSFAPASRNVCVPQVESAQTELAAKKVAQQKLLDKQETYHTRLSLAQSNPAGAQPELLVGQHKAVRTRPRGSNPSPTGEHRA